MIDLFIYGIYELRVSMKIRRLITKIYIFWSPTLYTYFPSIEIESGMFRHPRDGVKDLDTYKVRN